MPADPHRAACRALPLTVRLALLLALLPAPLAALAQASLVAPAPSGPHAVGRTAVTWTDAGRRDPVDSMRARTIPGWIWYPAARSSDGARPSEVALAGAWGEVRAEASARKIGPAAAGAMRTLRVHATTGAPWAPEVARAPVVVFAPGNGWLPTDYAALVEDLASHGYVVLGVASPGLADVVRLDDGAVVRKVLGHGPAIVTDQRHAHADVLHVLADLARMDADASSIVHGRLDLTRVAAVGHSLGGTTALVAAARDTTVRAAVNLDGDAMGVVLDVRPMQPLLLVSHEVPPMDEAPPRDSTWRELTRQGLERSERRRTAEWAAISSSSVQARRLRIAGLRHLHFTDAALAAHLVEGPDLRFMRWGTIDGAHGLRVVADIVRAFLDHVLHGRAADPLLTTPGAGWAEVRVVTAEAGSR